MRRYDALSVEYPVYLVLEYKLHLCYLLGRSATLWTEIYSSTDGVNSRNSLNGFN